MSSSSPLRLPAKKSNPEKPSARGPAFKSGTGLKGGVKSADAARVAVEEHVALEEHVPDGGTVRARLSAPARLVTAEPPNLRLDPFGVAGTGTARRLRTARVRRQWRLLIGSLTLAAILGAGLSLLIHPQSAVLSVQGAPEVRFAQSAPAALTLDAAYVPALDGTLWKVAPGGTAQIMGGDSAAFPARVAPLATETRVFLASLDGTLTAFDAKTNRALWHQSLGSSLSTTPVAFGPSLIVAANDAGQVMALNANTGAHGWTAQANGPVGDALAATREGIVVPSLPSAHGRGALECFDAKTGARRWRFPQNILDAAPGIAAPLYEPGRNLVFWASDYGFVIALNATTGAKVWKTFAAPLKGADSRTVTLRGAPALWKNTLLVGGNDGTVRAFNAENGSPLWLCQLAGAITFPARFVQCDGQTLASVSDAHELVLLDIETGQIVRRAALDNHFGVSWFPHGGWMQDAHNQAWRLGAY